VLLLPCLVLVFQHGNIDRDVQVKSTLESATHALARQQRQEDADAVSAAVASATKSDGLSDLLSDAIKAGRQQLEVWQNLTASEAKLVRVLDDGATTQQLSRAIQEATAAGVKVASAKRTLKVRVCMYALYNSPATRARRAVHPLNGRARVLLCTKVMCAKAKGKDKNDISFPYMGGRARVPLCTKVTQDCTWA
jgi:hypothetical protein